MIFQSKFETKSLKFHVKFRSEKKSQKNAKINDFRPYRIRIAGIRDGPLEEQSSFFYQGRSVPSEAGSDTLGGNVRSGTPRALFTLRAFRRGQLKARVLEKRKSETHDIKRTSRTSCFPSEKREQPSKFGNELTYIRCPRNDLIYFNEQNLVLRFRKWINSI